MCSMLPEHGFSVYLFSPFFLQFWKLICWERNSLIMHRRPKLAVDVAISQLLLFGTSLNININKLFLIIEKHTKLLQLAGNAETVALSVLCVIDGWSRFGFQHIHYNNGPTTLQHFPSPEDGWWLPGKWKKYANSKATAWQMLGGFEHVIFGRINKGGETPGKHLPGRKLFCETLTAKCRAAKWKVNKA